jgi:hypothetical protein
MYLACPSFFILLIPCFPCVPWFPSYLGKRINP